MSLRSAFLIATALFALLPTVRAQRQSIDLATGWKFLKADALPLAKTDTWETVSIPHSWNAIDGANGKAADPESPEGYHRGPAWYARPLDIPAHWRGKRVFIRFEGVALVADVLVNAIPVGQHRGGFAAFCYELTPYLNFDGKDTLRVRVDNSRAFDVAPLSGDFTVFGGIYRPVHLIATDEVCVTPLDHASSGVYLTPKTISKESASVEVKALISNGAAATSGDFKIEIKDAAGVVVASDAATLALVPHAENTLVKILAIPAPRLWQGRKDPYLYSVTVSLLRDGHTVDAVTQPLGLRTAAITQDRGFLLNGVPYPLHGVNRHQDLAGKGWALNAADEDVDHALIMEIGATCLRLAHYQQDEHVHDLNDRDGLVVWQEIPLVDTVGGSPQFLENARQQLTEMILQDYNHPSVAMWSLFNELDAGWALAHSAPAVPIIENLKQLSKSLDTSRLIVGASYPQDAGPRHKIPDEMGWNIYPGWYSAMPEDATAWIEKYSAQLGRRISISEYGAGANPHQFEEGVPKRPEAGGPFHPQEWQNHVHERLWAQFKDNPHLWGTYVWAMFDFASDGRNEGETPGINDKGLVTRDRKIKKDTFYFYKANWNPEPMLYLASRRMTPRKLATTTVKAYSNCAQVELKVNGRALGTAQPDDIRVCLWENVQLQPGVNRIEISARSGDREITDSCEWTLEAAPPAPANPPPPRP